MNIPSKKNVIILVEGSRADTVAELKRLRPTIERYLNVVAVSLDFSVDFSKVTADFVLVLGGDGSMLRAANLMQYHQIPTLGVNLGKLGFLADIQPDELETALSEIVTEEAKIISHLMFECEVFCGPKRTYHSLGLNEASILAGPPFKILDVQLFIDEELVTTYSCDGLIISTPVGSTAHNLSAGGPILRKNLQAFVISPISPHTLTNRPVVDTAERIYELVVPQPNKGTSLVVDGQVLCQLTGQERIRITRSKAKFLLLKTKDHGYYRTLREKLGWGGRLEQLSN